MKRQMNVFCLFLFLFVIGGTSVFGAEEDKFFTVALSPSLAGNENHSSLGLGVKLGYQMGINDRTDFSFDGIINVFSANQTNMDPLLQGQFTFSSFYTPYFGQIRPLLGGSFGVLSHTLNGETSVGLIAGIPLRILYDAGDRMNFLFGVEPKFSFGDISSLQMAFNMGIQFRIGE